MKRHLSKPTLCLPRRGLRRGVWFLSLLAVLALACDLSQLVPAPPPPPPAVETEAAGPLGEPAADPSPTPEAVEPAETLEAEAASPYQQFLPLLAGGAATAAAKGLEPSPPANPTPPPTDLGVALSIPPTDSGAASPIPPTVLPTAYATITPIPLSYLCIPPQTPQLGLVTKVVDGDTIRVLLDGKEQKVRYIGVDAPESTTTQELFGKEATKFNAQLVRNQIVELYRDVSETDRYGRLLRYVVTNAVFVNLKLIEEGYATAVTFPPDVACAVIFQQAERTARALGKGLWASPASTATPNCDPAYPEVCIPSPPPDLSCNEISFRNFRVLPPDPHGFDQDGDGIGCEN